VSVDFISFINHILNSNVTITHGCVGKIVALLQAFGLSVGSCGLANVLQCGLGLPLSISHCPKRAKAGRKKQNKFLQIFTCLSKS